MKKLTTLFRFFFPSEEVIRARQTAWDKSIEETRSFLKRTNLPSDEVPPIIGWRKLI